MTRTLFFAALASFIGSAVSLADETYVPWSLHVSGIVQPGPEVPEECAAFFSPTGWGEGKWYRGQATELWISRIYPDCSVDAYMLWGEYKESKPGYVKGINARIEGNALTFLAKHNSYDAKVEYKMRRNGTLKASWQKLDDRSSYTSTTLIRFDSLRDGISLYVE